MSTSVLQTGCLHREVGLSRSWRRLEQEEDGSLNVCELDPPAHVGDLRLLGEDFAPGLLDLLELGLDVVDPDVDVEHGLRRHLLDLREATAESAARSLKHRVLLAVVLKRPAEHGPIERLRALDVLDGNLPVDDVVHPCPTSYVVIRRI